MAMTMRAPRTLGVLQTVLGPTSLALALHSRPTGDCRSLEVEVESSSPVWGGGRVSLDVTPFVNPILENLFRPVLVRYRPVPGELYGCISHAVVDAWRLNFKK